MKKKHCIKEIEELVETLKIDSQNSSFVLFTGSAISGQNSPYLPMVQDVFNHVFKNISNILSSGTYSDKVTSAYAKTLYRDENHIGKYYYITDNTKFEEFLGIIQLIVGRKKLNKLLRILYLCNSNEFGPNHSAISWLLENRKVSICITTNFDNTIENSSSQIKSFTHLNFSYEHLSNINEPTLLKLHGDVIDNSCVSTNRSLFEHSNLYTYNFLKDLLKHNKVLVIGYSGDGDVDINPILSQTKSEFFWCEYSEKRSVQKYAKAKVICDLKSNDPKKNLLHGIASYFGWKESISNAKHDWSMNLHKWCRSISNEDLANIVVRTMLNKPDWPVIHIMNLYPFTLNQELADINRGRACLQKSVYHPAEKIFKKLVSSQNINHSQKITAKLYLGFVYWRMGKFKKALDNLWWFTGVDPVNYDIEKKIEISDGLRLYLEVARDWMQLTTFKSKRKKIYDGYKVDTIINKYALMNTYDFKDDILKKAVLLYIRYLIGNKVDKEFISEVLFLYNQSFYIKNWSLAEGIGRQLINISFIRGLKALLKVDIILIQRRQWNILRKSISMILNKMTLGLFPWLFIGLIDSPLLYRIMAPLKSYSYKIKLNRWEKLKRKELIKII